MARRGGLEPGRSGDEGASGTTRERILDVALDLFVRKGYAETSLREIAAELGFSKAALYYHFESKQDILMALHVRVHEVTGGLLPMLQADADVDETWERIIGELIGLALRNRRLLELHLRNQEAFAEMHRGPAMEKHAPVEHNVEERIRGLIGDRSASIERRVRRMASLGAIWGVLLASTVITDAPDSELETALRAVVHDVQKGTWPDGTSL
jgi:AcrR family transcriptional regulator